MTGTKLSALGPLVIGIFFAACGNSDADRTSRSPKGNGDGDSSACASGSEGCSCYGSGTCDGSLTCASNLCVDVSQPASGGVTQGGDGGTPGTGGNSDGGSSSGGTDGLGGALGGMGGQEVDACEPLTVVYRDFKGNGEAGGHPDFEISVIYPAASQGGVWQGASEYGDPKGSEPYRGMDEAGCDMVARALDESDKPTFNHGLGGQRTLTPELWSPGVMRAVVECERPGTWTWGWTPPLTIRDATSFSTWFVSEPGDNREISSSLSLEALDVPGTFVFESSEFFPLDGQGFGATPGQDHNHHFTSEIHAAFDYLPGTGQFLTLTGDHDMWVFVNSTLALDLGGLHELMTGTISFDSQAANLRLTEAGSYEVALFFAQRQTPDSNLSIATNIRCLQ